MSQAAAAESIPLVADSQGVVRITGTSVTLDTVVEAYRAGSTPEEIAQRHPSVPLADVYAVLTFYLRHKEEVDAYLRRRQEQATATRETRVPLIPVPPAGLYEPEPVLDEPAFPGVSLVDAVACERADLLARKHGGRKLSAYEQERLEFLTARLKESLPPVSPDDLEALLKMTKDMKDIRERARERRQQLGLR
jgi:uncharacterized protein (DUF433 family)